MAALVTSPQNTFAPGARVSIRDEEWLIRRVDRTSSGAAVLGVVGLSPLVEGKEARFIDSIELKNGEISVVDPRKTKAVGDISPHYSESRLVLESQIRASTPENQILHLGHRGAMDVLPHQVDHRISRGSHCAPTSSPRYVAAVPTRSGTGSMRIRPPLGLIFPSSDA